MTVHIYAPAPLSTRRLRRKCSTCERRTNQAAELYKWHGWHITCCVCGEAWEEDVRLPRPFERGWRQRQAAAARKRWAAYKESRDE